MSSPTQRTLKHLRDRGYTAQVVERWSAFAKKRIDLFGCIDIVAVCEGQIFGVQATAMSSAAARITKSLAEPRLIQWLIAGGLFEVWGWKKRKVNGKDRWQVSRKRISLVVIHGIQSFSVSDWSDPE